MQVLTHIIWRVFHSPERAVAIYIKHQINNVKTNLVIKHCNKQFKYSVWYTDALVKLRNIEFSTSLRAG